MKKMEDNKDRLIKIVFYCLVVVTIFWNIPFLNKGIDMDDSANSLSLYRYVFDDTNRLGGGSTLLTNIIGGIFYQLGGDYRVLLLNTLNLFSYLLTGGVLYHVLKRRKYDILLVLCVFLGTLYSCSWTRMLNYNSISMLFQAFALALIICGLKNRKFICCFGAGLILGLNIFIRLPNVLQACFGVVYLWQFGVLEKDWKSAFKSFFSYGFGGMLGLIAASFVVIKMMGVEKYINIFVSTASTATQKDSRHGLSHMADLFGEGIKNGLKTWLPWLVLLGFCLITWCICLRYKTKWTNLCYTLIIVVICGISWYTSNRYDVLKLPVMLEFGGIIGTFTIGIALFFTCFFYKRDKFLSSLALLLLLSESVLTFGTDNGWYLQVIFMIFPLMASSIFLTSIDHKIGKTAGAFILSFMLVLVANRGIKYGTEYVFRDDSIDELKYSVSLPGYKLMKTSKHRAKVLNSLEQQLVLYAKKDKELLALGNASICYAIADATSYVNSAWPDLEGLTLETFSGKIEQKISEGNMPIVVFVDMGYNQPFDLEKYEYVQNMLVLYEYNMQYKNDNLTVYTK